MAKLELGKEDMQVFEHWKKMLEATQKRAAISAKEMKTAIKCDYDRKRIANAMRNTILNSATLKPVKEILKGGECCWRSDIVETDDTGFPTTKKVTLFGRLKSFFKGLNKWLS